MTLALVNEPRALVEHFFRHEYGRLVGLLTGALGVCHLELVEDVVQMALWRALQNWARQGIPDDPGGWLYRTARNLAIDALRRQANFQRVAAQAGSAADTCDHLLDVEAGIDDQALRLLFLCCHPSLSVPSQIALALKTTCGFSVSEIASGLLVSGDTVQRRLSRAKARLREVGEEISDLNEQQMLARRESVMQVLYLMFNEGFCASSGDSPIKRDLCDEAIRLTRMLGSHAVLGNQPAIDALLALMLMHSARFATRVDTDQCSVLLADQDRQQWDWHVIRQAMQWMLRAARGELLSRYHIEVAIAWEHTRAASFELTDWPKILQLYDLLQQLAPSPVVRLNRIVAASYAINLPHAIDELLRLLPSDREQLRPWWDCAMAHFLERAGQPEAALSHWRDALALCGCSPNRLTIERKIASMLD